MLVRRGEHEDRRSALERGPEGLGLGEVADHQLCAGILQRLRLVHVADERTTDAPLFLRSKTTWLEMLPVAPVMRIVSGIFMSSVVVAANS